LGATGKIGRIVIRTLMSLQQELTVVAFTREYERACEVLYDDLIREHYNEKDRGVKKPKLQLIVMDLVPPNEVAGYHLDKGRKRRWRWRSRRNDDDDDDDDDDEEEYAVSAARFYNEDVTNYNNYNNNNDEDDTEELLDPYQPLYDAMKNTTAIISTIGTIRETIPFLDYVVKPWRIFTNPKKWCQDSSHPYYVNYRVMEKVIRRAEKEQRKRNEEWRVWEEYKEEHDIHDDEDNDYDEDDNGHELLYYNDMGEKKNLTQEGITPIKGNETNIIDNIDTIVDNIINNNNINNNNNEPNSKKQTKNDKIRIIRISDLCVANPPWDFVTMLTNIVRSQVFKYQEKCEKLLMSTNVLDTIILRPGDLVDEERNLNTTSLQVNMDGSSLPLPCYVGREDVAQLATIASLYELEPRVKKQKKRRSGSNDDDDEKGDGSSSTSLSSTSDSDSDTMMGLNEKDNPSIEQDTTTRRPNLNRKDNKTLQQKSKTKQKQNKEAKHWNIAIGWTENQSIRRSSTAIKPTSSITATKTKTAATLPTKLSSKKLSNIHKPTIHNNAKSAFQYIIKEEHKCSKTKRHIQAKKNKNLFYKFILGPIQNQIQKYHIRRTKPYGIFVLLPMIFIVYPMVCSILYSIGKRLPLVETVVMKILSYLKPLWFICMQYLRLAMVKLGRQRPQLNKLIY